MIRRAAFAVRLTSTIDPYSIRLVAPFEGHWLTAYDPDKHDGIGEARFDPDPAAALRFVSVEAATEFWSQQSAVKPILAGPGPAQRDAWEDAVNDARARGNPPPPPLAVVENRPLAQATNISVDQID